MRFKVNEGDWSDWEAVASEKEITLEDLDVEQRVYYEVKDKVGRTSSEESDTITLDRSLPTGSLAIQDPEEDGDGVTQTRDLTLTLEGDDETSGIDSMRFSQDGGATWRSEE